MNKMQIAHDWAMKRLEDPDYVVPMDEFAAAAWRYADIMQAEAEKRECKERPDVLCEVDWRLCPSNEFTHWIQPSDGLAFWYSELNQSVAPSFGFTGSHIVERPQ